MTEPTFRLRAVVAVDPERRIRCQQPHCGHSVYARIHVVEEAEQLLVLGSDCFAKRFGQGHAPNFGGHGAAGRVLTEAERELLLNNTRALLAQFEAERQKALVMAAQALLKQRALAEAAQAKLSEQQARWAKAKQLVELRRGVPLPIPTHDVAVETDAEVIALPSWAPLKKEHSSFFAYGMDDGQCWVLMQSATHPGCFIAPAPTLFDSWDEALPPSVGHVDTTRGVYESDASINVLSGWFVGRSKNGSRIDSDPIAIQRYALGLKKRSK